jgi:sRNA-binding protein
MTKGEKVIAVALLCTALSVLFTQPSYAQPFPESSRQKTQEELKKQQDKATEEAYKAYEKRTATKSNKQVDPWGNIRAPGK